MSKTKKLLAGGLVADRARRTCICRSRQGFGSAFR
jgi:hypothetical protein